MNAPRPPLLRRGRDLRRCLPYHPATATFLFTDIEGSTRLLRRMGEGYPAILREHREIIRAAITAHAGREMGTEGDSFFVLFDNARDGVAAAVDAQLRLSEHDWREAGAVQVRMGLHTGDARQTEDGVIGLAVHVAARLAATAHGGQVLLSEVTAAQVEDALPADTQLVDLGLHRLRDVTRPMRLFQVGHPALRRDFPRPRTVPLGAGRLPHPTTSFVGREEAVEEVASVMERSRATTITGAGGTGKTRLAIEVARAHASRWPDGWWFVDLAEVTDVGEVQARVQEVFQLTSREPDVLLSFLGEQELLLVLDNCERVLPACTELVRAILERTAAVRVLATTRAPLGVTGEAVYPLGPLQTPRTDDDTSRVVGSAAARLLIDRVRLHDPHFAVGTEDVAALATLCQGLDGNPLALELVASRVGVLSLQECVLRLGDRFRLLRRSGGGRHDALYSTVDWSYQMLDEHGRALAEWLSVFRGGATLEGVLAVCAEAGTDEWEVLDVLSTLVARSLVVAEPGHPTTRYRQLETIREFCLARLRSAGREEEVRERHCEWVLDLIGRLAPRLLRPDPGPALRELAAEHDNIGAAIAWAHQRGDCDQLSRLVGSLSEYLFHAAPTDDLRRWLRWAMECESTLPEHVDVLIDALIARLIEAPPGWPSEEELHARAVAAARTLGDRRRELRAEATYRNLRDPTVGDDMPELLPEMEALDVAPWVATGLVYAATGMRRRGLFLDADRVLQRARALGDAAALQQPYVEYQSAMVSLELGDAAAARSHLEAALAARPRTGNTASTSLALARLGVLRREDGDVDEALHLLTEAVDIERRMGWTANLANHLAELGAARVAAGDIDGARAAVCEAAEKGAPFGAYSMAAVEFARGDIERGEGHPGEAARHYGAAVELSEGYHFSALTNLARRRLHDLEARADSPNIDLVDVPAP